MVHRRAYAVVRAQLHVVHVGEHRDLPAFREPGGPADVRQDHVHRAARQALVELVSGGLGLAHGDGDVESATELRVTVVILGGKRIFVVQHIVPLEGSTDPDRGRKIVDAGGIQHQGDPSTHALTNPLDVPYIDLRTGAPGDLDPVEPLLLVVLCDDHHFVDVQHREV